jgi:hypothetical protein
MPYILLDDVLQQEHSVEMVDLALLRSDARPYSLLIAQPTGTIEANDQFIRNQDRATAFAKHREFLNLAQRNAVELAVTPEYSCPWEVVRAILAERCLPHPGNIWVLGCESISPESLCALKSAYPEILWVHEPVHSSVTHTFLDPVCYILNALDRNAQIVPLVVIQFKTQHMAEHEDNIERDHLIEGTTRYILRNTRASVHLATLICSDTLNFNRHDLIDHDTAPYLIIHPQLVSKPYHTSFTQYRYDAFLAGGDNYEVLCVNWAKGFRIFGSNAQSPFGASGLYTKSSQLDLQDTTIASNHRKGLYYSRWQSHVSHIYLFNYAETVFCLQNTKPSQLGVEPVLRRRTGPSMLHIFTWDNEIHRWHEIEQICDGFPGFCRQLGQSISPLDSDIMNPVDKERLLCLSSGAIRKPHGNDWYAITRLTCFAAREDQKIRRMTVVQDPDIAEFDDHFAERYRRLRGFAQLRNHILTQPAMFPPCIEDLATDWRIAYPLTPNQYNTNLCSRDGNSVATVAFLGDETPAKAQSCFDTMADFLGDAKQRLVVWYRRNDAIAAIHLQAPRFDADSTESRRSILREE